MAVYRKNERKKERRAFFCDQLLSCLSDRLLGIPPYDDEPYPDEQEISLLGGLFPHYTLGIYDSTGQRLIVNRYLLDEAVLHLVSVGMSEVVIEHGIFIDQSEFESSVELQNSRYKRWVSYSDDQGFADHDVNRIR